MKKAITALRPPSARRVRAALLFGALIALEAAPVQAWLVVYAATESGAITMTAAPFWLVLGVLALFAAARWRLGRVGALVMTVAVAFCGIVSVLALTVFSPLAYGGAHVSPVSLSRLGDLAQGLLAGGSLLNVVMGFTLLTIYLGWRGMRLGEGAPLFSHVSRRFKIGIGALVLAIFGSLVSVPASARATAAVLLVMLTLEGFAGLCALALSRPSAGSGRADAIMPGAELSSKWQILAVVIALLIVASVAAIGGLLDLTAMRALFSWLSPAASVLNRFGSWLTQSLAYVLYLVIAQWLSFLIPKNLPNAPVHLPRVPVTKNHGSSTQVIPGQYVGIATVIVSALVVIAALAALYFITRALLRTLNQPAGDGVEEERELLDASGLLRQQARDVLHWLRGGRARAPEIDELRRGSARWLYRELLRAGAQVGFERRASETADEYAARLAGVLDGDGRSIDDPSAGDLRELARAYDDARYGEVGGDAPGEIVEHARRVTQRLGALNKEPASRRR